MKVLTWFTVEQPWEELDYFYRKSLIKWYLINDV